MPPTYIWYTAFWSIWCAFCISLYLPTHSQGIPHYNLLKCLPQICWYTTFRSDWCISMAAYTSQHNFREFPIDVMNVSHIFDSVHIEVADVLSISAYMSKHTLKAFPIYVKNFSHRYLILQAYISQCPNQLHPALVTSTSLIFVITATPYDILQCHLT